MRARNGNYQYHGPYYGDLVCCVGQVVEEFPVVHEHSRVSASECKS